MLTLYESGAHSRVALISTTGKTLRGIQRELSEVHTGYAQFNMNMYTLNCYMNPVSRVEFPYLKPLELTSLMGSYFSSDMVFISL